MKTRRNRRKLHRTRKRKQKGGESFPIFIKTIKNEKGKLHRYNVKTNETTARNIFEKLKSEIQQNNSVRNKSLYLTNQVTPRFRLKSSQIPPLSWPAITKENWNNKEKIFIPEKTYFFEYIDQTREEQEEEYRKNLGALKNVLDYCRGKYAGGKVIPGSSAVTEDYAKNVRQQFKFQKDPKTPIILIDPAFFEPGRFEFFEYLKFNENIELSKSLDETGTVKVFVKPTGEPFEIKGGGGAFSSISEAKQTIYLNEVLKQLKDGSGNILFDQMKELEIICIKLSIEGLNDYEKRGSFYDLLRSYGIGSDGKPVFPVYTFEE
jgi:hypothetical protein